MTSKLTTDEFKRKIFDFEKNKEWTFEGQLPAIVEFYADWCPPCKMIDPILHSISNEYSGKLDVYKMNTDEESVMTELFGIMSIPSILFIPKQGQPQMAVGALPKPTIVKAIREVMNVI